MKRAFKSLRKVNNFFVKRLNTMVNITTERVRLPCPYSRLSELIILEKCISSKRKNAVKKLETLYERHEKLIKQIKQENIDFKAIVARQGRELVSGKVRNIKVLYESEIYLLTMSVNHAQAQLQNNKNEIEEAEVENEKLKTFYANYIQRMDLTEMKELIKEVTRFQTECELIESEINEIDFQLANDDGDDWSESSTADDYRSRKSKRCNFNDFTGDNNIDNDENDNNNDNDETKSKKGDETSMINEAKTNIGSLKSLPWLVHNIFNKLINE